MTEMYTEISLDDIHRVPGITVVKDAIYPIVGVFLEPGSDWHLRVNIGGQILRNGGKVTPSHNHEIVVIRNSTQPFFYEDGKRLTQKQVDQKLEELLSRRPAA